MELANIALKNWSNEDKPREKLLQHGKQTLSDAELIAILLGSGSKNESAVGLARKLLHYYQNSLHELAKLSASELQKFKGIGEAKALSIIAALELGRRRKDQELPEHILINCSKDAYVQLAPKLLDLPHEEFWMLLLNRRNKVVKTELISRGGISGTVADVRLILKSALENLATSIVLAHNHPSGSLLPSREDQHLTQKVKQAASLFDIQVVDHLIIGDKSYYSFADEGNL